MLKSCIRGVGRCLPARIVTNDELAAKLDTSDAWIVERTGISKRHIAGPSETTVSLGIEAARAALAHAGLSASQIDLVVLATSTPDYTFPASATMIQAGLGIQGGAAFDVQAVCSGFIYALTLADSLIKTGQATHALVVGAETFSRILDWEDRSTCVLFGDGAGAVVLSGEPDGGRGVWGRGIHRAQIRSDGRYCESLYVDGGVSKTQTVGHLRMNGREVFRHAVENISSVMGEVLEKEGISGQDIDWFIPHQANVRILDGVARKVGIDPQKVIVTIDHHANTSAASVPLALCEAVEDGRIQPGHLLLLEAMGGGFTWGAVLVRW